MSMLDEDEEYEDEVLYERRGTSVLRSARPELVVPTPWTSRLWTEVPESSLWPRACSATGLRASMRQSRVPRFRPAVLGGCGNPMNFTPHPILLSRRRWLHVEELIAPSPPFLSYAFTAAHKNGGSQHKAPRG